MKIITIKNNKGFTLIEALVSTALILLAVIGPLSLTLNSINTIMQNKNRVIASYLAEEIVEEFRAYRDGFVLACKDINIVRDSNGDATSAYCTHGGTNISLSPTILSTMETGSETSERVGWQLFLERISNILDKNVALDRTSFPYNNLDILSEKTNCTYLYLDSNKIYSCNGNNQTYFNRKIRLTKNLSSIHSPLRIEVEVIYTKAGLLGLTDKSVKVIDYIYER